jgi:hypothetical protein
MRTLFVCVMAAIAAQAQNLTMRGVITDPAGAAIPGAMVTLTGPDNFIKAAQADAEGRYALSGLRTGQFVLRATSTGFSVFERQVELAGDRAITFNIAMRIAVETQQVTVSESSTVAVDASDPSKNAGALVLKGEDLQMLSDNPDDLASDLQALAGPAAGPNGGQIFIDGFSGGRLPPKESIREVRINSNPFAAEYDRLGFGRIEIFTKPGTDQYHGSVFFNFTDDVFNSRNPYSTIRPPYQQRFFGGNISGPLVSKKASFSFDAERRNVDETSVINAVTLDSNFNPETFSTAILNPTVRTNLNPRIDYQLNANNTLVGRYSFSKLDSENEGITALTLPSRAFSVANTDHTVQLTETAVLGPRAINELRFQYIRRNNDQLGDSSTPTINVLDSFTGGGAPFSVAYSRERRWELSNMTSVTAGTHLIKFGGRARGVNTDDFTTSNYNGTYIFSTLRAYQLQLQGLAAGLTNEQIRAQGGGPSQLSVTGGTPLANVSQFDIGLFVQDDWRWKPNVTISTGLRYETQTNISSYLNFAPRIGIAWGVGKPGSFGRPQTVVRAGWGVFYDRFDEGLTLQARRLDGVIQQQFLVPNPNTYPSIPTLDQLQPFRRDQAIQQVDGNLTAPYVMQTVFGVERQLPKNITVAMNYANTRGLHSLRSRNINAPLPGSITAENPQGIRPFGNLGNIYNYESTGLFKQNQLITNLSARISPKLTMFGFYMLNFARGDTDGAQTFPANQYDLSSEWGRTRFDVRHRVVMGGSITTWKGVQLNPFVIANSGAPFNITLGRDLNGDAQFTDRPALAAAGATGPNIVDTRFGTFNVAPGPNDTLIARNYANGPSQFFVNLRASKTWGWGERNTAAADPAAGPMMRGPMGGGPPPGGGGGGMRGGGGPGGRGGGGPMGGMFGGNSGKKYSLTFSVSARNLLNTVNPGQPIGTLTSSLFGESNQLAGGFFTTATANRRVDLQLRFSF